MVNLLTYLRIYIFTGLHCFLCAQSAAPTSCLLDVCSILVFLFTYLLQFYCREYEAVKHDGT